jgi:hypothetical protein
VKPTSHAIEPSASVCPRYIAFAGGDDFIDADNDLETLIAQLVADNADQDIAIWDNLDSLVAVVLSDGTVHKFTPKPNPKRVGTPQTIRR